MLCLSNLDLTHEQLEHRVVQVSPNVSTSVREGPLFDVRPVWRETDLHSGC